jgi:hypothetical protein
MKPDYSAGAGHRDDIRSLLQFIKARFVQRVERT